LAVAIRPLGKETHSGVALSTSTAVISCEPGENPDQKFKPKVDNFRRHVLDMVCTITLNGYGV
jgi:hypothetical protein